MKENPIGTIWLLFAFDGTVMPQNRQHNHFCVQKSKERILLFIEKKKRFWWQSIIKDLYTLHNWAA